MDEAERDENRSGGLSASLSGEHKNRSEIIRALVQKTPEPPAFLESKGAIPKRIIQYWHNSNRIPEDVKKCMESWEILTDEGFDHVLYDDLRAAEFIRTNLGPVHSEAYAACYHPAMRSDYFRLCYIYLEGGCYIDADDVYSGQSFEHLFENPHLKLQPLCYDITTDSMVPPHIFTVKVNNSPDWVFYFNNNPLIAASNNLIINIALESSTYSLLKKWDSGLPDIQSTTGPGNLTKCIASAINDNKITVEEIEIQHFWENFAASKWPLSYRNDKRNWRLSDRLEYIEETE